MKRGETALVALCCSLCLETTVLCANPLRNPPFSMDALILIEGSEALLREAEVRNVTAGEDGREVLLAGSSLRGSFVTAPGGAAFGFNEAIPSWNGRAGPGAGFRVYLRIRQRSDTWSPWLEFGSWGDPPPRVGDPATEWEDGHVEIDVLFSDKPAVEFQFRVDFFREKERTPSPSISLLALSFSNTMEDRDLWERHRRESRTQPRSGTAPIDLQVPFRSQKWEDPSMADSICSPTSVAMALEFLGIETDTARMARQAFDPDHGIYGNWSRNVQAAAHHGARGYIDRFRSWDRVRETLEQGSPIVAAIRFKRGELEDPPYQYSPGHLLVIRGFTAEGNIITNDPYLGEDSRGDGWVWKAADLATAWFDRGGVGYVLTPREGSSSPGKAAGPGGNDG